jgi:hypothetical protein
MDFACKPKREQNLAALKKKSFVDLDWFFFKQRKTKNWLQKIAI